jgi:hypothetical protein
VGRVARLSSLSFLGVLFAAVACGKPAPLNGNAGSADEETGSSVARTGEQSAIAAALVASRSAASEACPRDMVLVEGDYCPEVRLNCKRYLDPKGGAYEHFRCAEYAPSTCESRVRRRLRYCIDRHEYVADGESLPANFQSFTHAEEICGGLGKRVCFESEWNFACEGEAMQPYPYGFRRDADACNADRTEIVSAAGRLRDLRSPPGAHPRCSSPFGVLDLSGNVEEFVAIDGSRPVRPAMKGAYWQPGRNFCRAAQTAHDRYYNGTETGFRCCADVRSGVARKVRGDAG